MSRGGESAPQPLLDGKCSGDDVLEGWLVIEIPAASANYDLFLVYGHGEWTDGIEDMIGLVRSALLRRPVCARRRHRLRSGCLPRGLGSPAPHAQLLWPPIAGAVAG